jgi:hypothetical protein
VQNLKYFLFDDYHFNLLGDELVDDGPSEGNHGDSFLQIVLLTKSSLNLFAGCAGIILITNLEAGSGIFLWKTNSP